MLGQDQDRASRSPSLGTMNWIMMAADFALKAYDLESVPVDPERRETYALPQLPECLGLQDCPHHFEAILIKVQLSRDAQQPSDYVQLGIWYVVDMGYVVAFKGTIVNGLLDWLINVNMVATPIEGSQDISVHKGFAQAKSARDMILETISTDWHRRRGAHLSDLPHLLVTGPHLSAIHLLLLLCSDN